MNTGSIGRMQVVETRREPVLADGVLGMLLFVFAEIMLFAGMISAFTIIQSSAPLWPPPGQPRLPVWSTALNTLVLLASGWCLFRAQRRFPTDRQAARRPLLFALVLGVVFVAVQGAEWVALMGQGLTLTSSSLGSFFYLIVGLHALHAIGALVLLGKTWRRYQRGWLARSQLATAGVLWYFVVGLWPVLYGVVYW